MPVASPYPFSELFKIRWTRYSVAIKFYMIIPVWLVTASSECNCRTEFSLAHCARSTVATPLKDHQPRPLHMRINVFAGLKQVRII